jgi:hypothetical protein
MQDEDVQPTDQFLIKLAELLKTHNRPVPFAVPQIENKGRTKLLIKLFNYKAYYIIKRILFLLFILFYLNW